MEISGEDIIRIILQFFHENKLDSSYSSLLKETNIDFNSSSTDPQTFINDIKIGNWISVIRQINAMKLPQLIVFDIMEEMILELIDLHEHEVARRIIQKNTSLQAMLKVDQQRYNKIIELVQQKVTTEKKLKEERFTRRDELSKQISPYLNSAPPSRLLTLVGHGIKWENKIGLIPPQVLTGKKKIDLFTGRCIQQSSSSTQQQTSLFIPKSNIPESPLLRSLSVGY
ncbi:MAG: putative WD-40 repeat protein [Streblomastix strix]|uniref:Putative WD-40 repeat protein n=1 Tax=Streblomastix strix TaxID=222440 RepID=A0A5J4WQ69_9EUKA|nr:MAG: putative WD-40 repeat protein [Streblomastix strix]